MRRTVPFVALLAVACGGIVDQPTTTAEGGAAGAPVVAPEVLTNEDGSLSVVSDCGDVLRLTWTVQSDSFPSLEIWAEPRPTSVDLEQAGPGEFRVTLTWQEAPPSVVLVRGFDTADVIAHCS